jgi:hypothetical protein
MSVWAHNQVCGWEGARSGYEANQISHHIPKNDRVSRQKVRQISQAPALVRRQGGRSRFLSTTTHSGNPQGDDAADPETYHRDNTMEQHEFVNAFAETRGTVPMSASQVIPTSQITRANGGKVKNEYHDSNLKHRYIDEYTGDVLDPKLIRAAIMEELNYCNDKHIWQLEDLRRVREIADAVHVRTRWVLCNKGDEVNPDTRARLVAC